MNQETQIATTISIELKGGGFWGRLPTLPRLLRIPFEDRQSLFKEYTEWKILGMFPKRWNKLAYIIDHSVFWGWYCLLAVIRGKAKGFQWYLGHSGIHCYGLERKV